MGRKKAGSGEPYVFLELNLVRDIAKKLAEQYKEHVRAGFLLGTIVEAGKEKPAGLSMRPVPLSFFGDIYIEDVYVPKQNSDNISTLIDDAEWNAALSGNIGARQVVGYTAYTPQRFDSGNDIDELQSVKQARWRLWRARESEKIGESGIRIPNIGLVITKDIWVACHESLPDRLFLTYDYR